MVVSVGVVISLSSCCPWVLSDSNQFMKQLIGPELLSVLGVILAITLASTAQIHLAFNKVEEDHNKTVFDAARSELRQGSYSLIGSFAVALAVLLMKSVMHFSEVAISLVNGSLVILLVFNLLVLTDITRTVFALPAIPKPREPRHPDALPKEESKS
jgi:hypothetical protein